MCGFILKAERFVVVIRCLDYAQILTLILIDSHSPRDTRDYSIKKLKRGYLTYILIIEQCALWTVDIEDSAYIVFLLIYPHKVGNGEDTPILSFQIMLIAKHT